MLEIKNLTKIYETKGGIKTKALDNVSIKFPETGMVFLLGRSGSGKSTLLNIAGGLDEATSGEVIVKGRSSKDFSHSDFDSYRNTFIGFVFQEYNILNEFSVEDNIALALELQGKKKDKARIQELLNEVDLKDHAKRKPNTLSGGQKQRIAIARALVKSPEIIMADEPTGALDSNTGKQVLDTLKKLSETKLVIVVSHDREFAFNYGDRVVELKDGKIILDVSKTTASPLTNGLITRVDADNIIIPSGKDLDEDTLRLLSEFIKGSKEEILISKGVKEIERYKEVNHISSDGKRDKFIETNEDSYALASYTKADSHFIKSKLPFRHGFKMGVSNLKLKPIRLFFTLLLTTASLILLGLFSTMMFYDKESVAVNSLNDKSVEYLSVKKKYQVLNRYENTDYTFTRFNDTNFSDKDLLAYSDKFSEMIPYYNFNSEGGIQIDNTIGNLSPFYFSAISGFANVKEDSSLRNKIIAGSYPTKTDEIMLSKYTFDSLKENKIKDDNGSFIILNEPSDLVGKAIHFSISPKAYYVTGIYEIPNSIPDKYLELKNGSSNTTLGYEWKSLATTDIVSLALVADGFYEANSQEFNYSFNSYEGIPAEEIKLTKGDTKESLYYIQEFKSLKNGYSLDGSSNYDASDSSLVISLGSSFLLDLIMDNLGADYDHLGDLVPNRNYNYYELINEAITGIKYNSDPNAKKEYLANSERLEAWKLVYSFIAKYNHLDMFNNITLSQKSGKEEAKSFNITGIYLNDSKKNDVLYMTSNNVNLYKAPEKDPGYTTKYVVDPNAKITGLYFPNSHDEAKLRDLVKAHYVINSDDSRFVVANSVMGTIDMANTMIEMFSQIFLYVGIALAVFASLLLFNFISVSITNKKREIGVLRAVGARGTDVFKIYFSESFIITIIATIASLILGFVLTGVINGAIGSGLGGMNLLVFGPKSFLLVVGLALIVMIISTYLPVYFIARKKPVESIRSL